MFDLQKIESAHTIFEENLQMRDLPGTPENRVDNMIKQLKQRLPKATKFSLMCSSSQKEL